MTKKVFVTAIIFLISAKVVAGGFQLSFGGGYGFGAGRYYVGYNNDMGPTDGITEWKDVYASLGNGIKLDIDGTYLLNDNFGIMFGTGFSMLGGYRTENVTQIYTASRKIIGNFVPITAGLKFYTGKGNVMPYLHVAPGVFIPVGVHGESEYNDSTTEISRKYVPGFCISSGIGLLLKVTNVVGLKMECTPFYGLSRIKEETLKRSNGTESTTIYLKDEENLPSPSNNKTYTHGGPTHSFSSIAAKMGVVLSF